MKNKLKLTIMSSFLVFSNLYGIGITDSEFIAKNKVIDKTEIITYTYDFGTNKSDGGVSEMATSTVTNASSLVKSKLTESGVYKVEVKYHYKNSELTNTNINNIHTFKNINTNSFINSNEENKLNNSFNINFYYGENGTGQTIGMISNTQGVGEIMSVSTVENTKEKYVSFIGQKFNGMAFYGDKIKEMCKNKETIPEYLIIKPDMISDYLNIFKGDKGKFTNSPDMSASDQTLSELKTLYKNQSIAVSLKSLGINNDSCVDILDDSVNVYEELANINLFNSDGTVNLDSKNLENNRLRMAFIMSDVMYDTYSDEAYLRYDDHWDTKSGTYCRKKVKFIGCVKHRMWQAFSQSNNMDKIISKKYTDNDVSFNNNLTNKNEINNISGMFSQKPFNEKDGVLPNSISSNYLLVSNVSPPSGFTGLTATVTPNERVAGSYDVEKHKDKGWSFWQWLLVILIVILIVVLIVMLWMFLPALMGAGTALSTSIAIQIGSGAVLGWVTVSTILITFSSITGLIALMVILGDFDTKEDNGRTVASYINSSNNIPNSLKEELENYSNISQINMLLNTSKSLEIQESENNEIELLSSNNSNDKYLSLINDQYFHSNEQYSKFTELYMKMFDKSDANIFETGDVHGTQVSGEDYFSKTNVKITSANSVVHGYFIYNNTKFNTGNRDKIWNLGNSIKYGVAGVEPSMNGRHIVLNNMTNDFNILIDREYKSIIRNFYHADGTTLNTSETE